MSDIISRPFISEDLPACLSIFDSNVPLFFSPEERAEFNDHLENLDASILLGGHSHKQEQKEYAGKTYLNPGSLGLALDGVGGHAHFAILTLENSTWQIECFQIPYDLEGYLAEFDRAELETHGSVLARSLKRTLTCGINYFYLTVKRVRELADALALTDLDEELWEKAERELK